MAYKMLPVHFNSFIYSSVLFLAAFQGSIVHSESKSKEKNSKNVKRSPEESDLINMFNKRTKIH